VRVLFHERQAQEKGLIMSRMDLAAVPTSELITDREAILSDIKQKDFEAMTKAERDHYVSLAGIVQAIELELDERGIFYR
jgi:hypothetical protein